MTLIAPTDTAPDATGRTGSVTDLTRAVALVGGLRGALRSGLVESLWRWQPCTSTELATRAHLAPRTVELVLRALDVGGIVVRRGQEWTLTAPPAAWAELASFVDRIGEFVDAAPRSTDDDTLVAADRTGAAGAITATTHRQLALQVAPALARPSAVALEIGTAAAPWASALRAVEPTMDVVTHERPPAAGSFDVIVLSVACRPADDEARLLEHCRSLLAPAGRLAVCVPLVDAARLDHSCALDALGVAARVDVEPPWTAADHHDWLVRSGFAEPELLPAAGGELVVLITNLTDHRPTGTDESDPR